MNKPMMVFSFRTSRELVRKFKRVAKKMKKSAGELLREIIEAHITVTEEKNVKKESLERGGTK